MPPARVSWTCLPLGALGWCLHGHAQSYDDLPPHPCLNQVGGVFFLSSRDPLGSRRRAVWLPVGHTHSESPAGVNGLSRLPSPGFGNWVGSPVLFLETGLGHQSWRQSTADHYTARLSPGRSTAYNCGCDLTSSNLELYQLKDRRLQHPRFVPIQHRVLPIVN